MEKNILFYSKLYSIDLENKKENVISEIEYHRKAESQGAEKIS